MLCKEQNKLNQFGRFLVRGDSLQWIFKLYIVCDFSCHTEGIRSSKPSCLIHLHSIPQHDDSLKFAIAFTVHRADMDYFEGKD